MLFWCWAAALGAGLLKSEDMMLGATRLRVTSDIVYEEENLSILMDEAAKVTTNNHGVLTSNGQINCIVFGEREEIYVCMLQFIIVFKFDIDVRCCANCAETKKVQIFCTVCSL